MELAALNLALEKLGNIKGLRYTCSRNQCEICERLEGIVKDSRYIPKKEGFSWFIDLSLFSWQKEAIDTW